MASACCNKASSLAIGDRELLGTKARIWARQADWYVAAVLASSFQDKK